MPTKPFRGARLNIAHRRARRLVQYHLFNEKTGTTTFDLSLNSNHGRLLGGTLWKPDGLYFDGANDYISYSSNPVLFPDAFTVEATIKTTATGSTLIRWANYSPSIFITINKFVILLGSNNYSRFERTPIDYLDGNWHHVAFVVTGNGQNDIDNSKMFTDGVEQDVDTVIKTGATNAKTLCEIGRRSQWNDEAFNGTIGEFKMFDLALSADEILHNYYELYAMIL